MTDSISDEEVDRRTIDRRNALRAALGGAAAAAAFTAPRIEGFSIAPNYASAGTCKVDGSRSVTVTGSRDSDNCCSQTLTTLCYGGSGCVWDCNGCGGPNNNSNNYIPTTNGTLDIPLNNVAPINNISLSYIVGGATREYLTDWNNDSRVTANISGLATGRSCVVTVNGTCGSGTYRFSAANHINNNDSNGGEWGSNLNTYNSGTINANSWSDLGRRKVDCQGFENSFSNANVALTINLTCTC